MGEQTNQGHGEKINELVRQLSNISKKIEEQRDYRKPELKYNDDTGTNVKTDKERDSVQKNESIFEELGLEVKVYENIDIKDVSKESKFTIRILNQGGCYVDVDMFGYRDIVIDFEKSEEEFIASKLERIMGIDKDIDKASRAICEYLSVVCYDKDMQTKRYRELGWGNYGGVQIFKYDQIYIVSEEMDSIRSECDNEVAEGLVNKADKSKDYADWLVDFSTIMNYSDINALIIATACTGVIRQLLPYTKENNINMNIVGDRASGKSIISHFALSMFGDPSILEGSFTDTDNAVEMLRVERAVLPYILDERMLKVEGKSEDSKRRTLLMDIFREYEGKVKERMAGQGKEQSGKRTYGPIISSSVEPILPTLLKESRDLGQYRRFIELEIEAKNLFFDSRMAESTEAVAYTHYGYGVFMLVNTLIEEMKEDGDIVVDTYNEINEIITAVLRVIEKDKKLETMLCPCAKRFALIITTLEFLLNGGADRGVTNFNITAGVGWIDQQLDESGIQKIKECKEENKNSDWDKSNLGKGIKSYFNAGKRLYTKSENVLGVLIDNAVSKMKRLKSYVDIYAKIIEFIERHRSLFYEEDKKWDGKGDYIGRLQEDNEKYTIHIKVKRDIEWVLVYGAKLSDDELKEYIEWAQPHRLEMEIEEKVKELLGDVMLADFGNLVESDYNNRMTWADGDSKRGKNNVTLAEIVLMKDLIDSKKMKDSDKEDGEENDE